MPSQSRPARVLIYSHDSFGLGHLRRCRTIAHAIVDEPSGPSVLVLSGSPIIGSFDFRPRVDFVRVPGVIKLRNGEDARGMTQTSRTARRAAARQQFRTEQTADKAAMNVRAYRVRFPTMPTPCSRFR